MARLWTAQTTNILFSLELSNWYGSKGLIAFSVHPGAIRTNLAKDFKPEDGVDPFTEAEGNAIHASKINFKTVRQGTATHIVAAFDSAIESQSGSYLQDCQFSNTYAELYTLDNVMLKSCGH